MVKILIRLDLQEALELLTLEDLMAMVVAEQPQLLQTVEMVVTRALALQMVPMVLAEAEVVFIWVVILVMATSR